MDTRRSFFEHVALASALAALLEREGHSQPVESPKVSKFWDAYFAEASREPGKGQSRGASTTDANLMDPAKKVQLIQATPEGLQYPDQIADSALLPDSNVVVTVKPSHFRPSPDDHKAVARSRGCQVRMDFMQTRPIMNLIAPMTWAGLAAWSVDKTSYSTSTATSLVTGKKVTTTKLNQLSPGDLKDLDFRDPNDPNAPLHDKVILPGGSGRVALNVRAVSVNPRLHSILDGSVSYASIIAPFFGFAPVALPALKALTVLLGAVFNHEAVIMNSMPLQVLASQDARKNPHDAGSVKIINGDYIAVPTDQASGLQGNLDKLRVVEGWLVHQDSKPDLPVAERAKDPKVPRVTYMSMNFNVKSLADAQTEQAKG